MNIENLENIIRKSSFAEHENYLKSLIIPSVEINVVKSEIKKGSSRLGGIPDLPLDFEWPKNEHGDYKFVAQFNLGEIPKPPIILPTKGILSIFIAGEDAFCGDDDYAKIFYFDRVEKLETYTKAPSQPILPIKFETSIDLPLRRDLLKDCPFNQEQRMDFSIDFVYDIDTNHNHLLGYPFYSSLAYDPRPDENWVNLLTLSSEDELNWCWHDGGFLMLFIEKEKLEKKDFSYIKADIG